MKKLIPALFLVTIFSFITCDDNPVNGDDTKPGRRDYTWTVDTLMTPAYTLVRRMWGSGQNDVWAILSGADLDRTIWHYDGVSWTTDGVFRSIEPASIFGFAPENIWLGGHQGEIWHYDGTSWSPFTILVANQGTTITWENIWGVNPNDIYAVGAYKDRNLLNNNGVIAHFDGSSWNLLNINGNGNLVQVYKDLSGYYFIRGTLYGMIDTSKVFLLIQNKLTEIYSNQATSSYIAYIGLINDRVLISYGKDIYTYLNNHFKLFYSVGNLSFTGGIYGRSLKDIFLGMRDGIAHYDGNDVQYLVNPKNPNTGTTSNFILEKEVFFPFYDFTNGKTYMYKGTLTDN
jgi:hypothetical protein